MKKKNLAVYALMGALMVSPVFTSCVDDTESAAVTAVRNAKIEQLKSLAAMDNALAQAETIAAAAAAKVREADAAMQKANEEYYKAQEALKKTQDEQQKVALLVAQKQAEYDIEYWKGEIQKLEIQTQINLQYAQADLLVQKQRFEALILEEDAKEWEKLQNLVNQYDYTVNDLIAAHDELARLKATLVKLENKFADAKLELENIVAEKNKQIEYNNIQIEAYKKYANYTEDLDSLEAEADDLYNIYLIKNDEYKKANSVYNDLNNELWSDGYNEARRDTLADLEKKIEIINYKGYWNEEGEWIDMNEWNFALKYIQIEYSDDWENELEFTYEDQTRTNGSFSLPFKKCKVSLTQDARQIELNLKGQSENLKEQLKNTQAQLTENEKLYATAVTATAAAKKAWDEAAEADKDSKKREYENALNTELSLKNQIEGDQESIEEFNKHIARIETALPYFLDFENKVVKEITDDINAYNKLIETTVTPVGEAWVAYMEAKDERTKASNERQAILAILNGYYSLGSYSIDYNIKNLEERNEQLLEEIAEAEELLTGYQNDYGHNLSYEEAIQYMKSEIKRQELRVAVCEKAVEDLKAELEEATGSDEEEEAE